MTHPAITEVVEAIGKMIDAHIQSWPLCEDRADSRVTRALEALFADRADYARLRSELTETQAANAKLVVERTKAFANLTLAIEQRDALAAQVATLTVERDRLKELLASVEAELEGFDEQRELRSAAEVERDALKEKLATAEKEREDELAKIRRRLDQKKLRTEVERDALQAEVDRLKSELARMEAVVSAARDLRVDWFGGFDRGTGPSRFNLHEALAALDAATSDSSGPGPQSR